MPYNKTKQYKRSKEMKYVWKKKQQQRSQRRFIFISLRFHPKSISQCWDIEIIERLEGNQCHLNTWRHSKEQSKKNRNRFSHFHWFRLPFDLNSIHFVYQIKCVKLSYVRMMMVIESVKIMPHSRKLRKKIKHQCGYQVQDMLISKSRWLFNCSRKNKL